MTIHTRLSESKRTSTLRACLCAKLICLNLRFLLCFRHYWILPMRSPCLPLYLWRRLGHLSLLQKTRFDSPGDSSMVKVSMKQYPSVRDCPAGEGASAAVYFSSAAEWSQEAPMQLEWRGWSWAAATWRMAETLRETQRRTRKYTGRTSYTHYWSSASLLLHSSPQETTMWWYTQ